MKLNVSFPIDVAPLTLDVLDRLESDCQVIYVERGTVGCRIGAETYHAHAGDLLVIGQRPHTFEPAAVGAVAGVHLRFNQEIIRQHDPLTDALQYLMPFLDQGPDFPHVLPAATGVPGEVLEMLRRIERELAPDSAPSRFSTRTYLKLILVYLVKHYSQEGERRPVLTQRQRDLNRLSPVFEFIETHYQEPLSVTEVASVANMSKSHFMRFFKHVSGQPFVAHLTQVRIAKAQEMLATSDRSIADICQEVGFCNQSYFGLVFRKLTRQSPREYKNRVCSEGMKTIPLPGGKPYRRALNLIMSTWLLMVSATAQETRPPEAGLEAAAILEQRCVACHAAGRAMGGVRFDDRASALAKGASGLAAIVPGQPDASELLRRVTAAEPRRRMPLGQKALEPAQVAVLEKWVRAGAPWPSAKRTATLHWAYRPLMKVAPPAAGHPIDAFLQQAQAAKKLVPVGAASRATLLRRLAFDLTGLPPTADDAAFSATHDLTQLADRFLASPRFGERWGRHWLDSARYADSEGYENDKDAPTLYRYRDFVIQAMNADMPFDQFLRWQLAGDEFAPHDPRALAATGFLTAGPRVHTAASDSAENKERFIYDQLDDMVSTTTVSFLATTAACARCHDHKYDPVPTRDYYRLASIFRNIDREEKPLSPAHWTLERWLRQRRAALREERMAALQIPASDRELLRFTLNRNHSGQAAAYREWDAKLKFTDEDFAQWLGEAGRAHWAELLDAAGKIPNPERGLFFLDSSATPLPSYLMARGDVSKKAEPVQFGFLSVLTHERMPEDYRRPLLRQGADTTFRRAALAEWLVDAERGAGALVARVIVNRLWQHHFGEGLVRTLDDFGLQGEKPSQPELLDWLAGELIRQNWRLKPIHRLIVSSAAYARGVEFHAANAALDPENRLLWRRQPVRLEAEAIRDSILAVSGSLNLRMYGPAVRPFIPPDAIATRTQDPWPKNLVDGPESWRRSVYLFVKRSVRLPLMETFDVPDPNTACGRRQNTTLPTQSLTLMNDAFVRQQAHRFAARVESATGADVEARIRTAYQLALSRPPSNSELSAARSFLADAELTDFCHALFLLNEFSYVD